MVAVAVAQHSPAALIDWIGQALSDDPHRAATGCLVAQVYVSNAAGAIAFYKRAFAAREASREAWPSGRVLHAELSIGENRLFVADADHQRMFAPIDIDQRPAFAFHLGIADVEAAVRRAIEGGARAIRRPEDDERGKRAMLADPFGVVWLLFEGSP
jgi:PhnB protein